MWLRNDVLKLLSEQIRLSAFKNALHSLTLARKLTLLQGSDTLDEA